MEKKKLNEFRDKLRAKHLELTRGFERNKSATHEDSGGGGSEDFVDYAVNAYTKEFLLSLSDLDRHTLQQVEDALVRVRTGEYGICQERPDGEECGKEIGLKRLDAVPWTPFCLSCQEMLENENRRMPAATSRFGGD